MQIFLYDASVTRTFVDNFRKPVDKGIQINAFCKSVSCSMKDIEKIHIFFRTTINQFMYESNNYKILLSAQILVYLDISVIHYKHTLVVVELSSPLRKVTSKIRAGISKTWNLILNIIFRSRIIKKCRNVAYTVQTPFDSYYIKTYSQKIFSVWEWIQFYRLLELTWKFSLFSRKYWKT